MGLDALAMDRGLQRWGGDYVFFLEGLPRLNMIEQSFDVCEPAGIVFV